MGSFGGYDEGTSVLPPLPISDMMTSVVGALATMLDNLRPHSKWWVVPCRQLTCCG